MAAHQKVLWRQAAAMVAAPAPANPAPLTAWELQWEVQAVTDYIAGTKTQAQLIRLNKRIETKRGRKLSSHELAYWARRISRWDVFSTPHRRRWWREWRRQQPHGTGDATRGLKAMWDHLAKADKDLWIRETLRLNNKKVRKREVYDVNYPYPAVVNHLRNLRVQQANATHMAQTGAALPAAQAALINAETWAPYRVLGEGVHGTVLVYTPAESE